MINPSRSPHFLTDGAATQARNDGGSSHRDAAFSPLRGNQHCCDPHVAYSLAQSLTIDAVAIVCPHCYMLYFGHPQRWHDASCCLDVGEQGEDFSCIHHIGFVVGSVLACAGRMEQAGAPRLTPLAAAGRRDQSGRGQRPSNAEVKLSGPDGLIIDISEFGWLGNSL